MRSKQTAAEGHMTIDSHMFTPLHHHTVRGCGFRAGAEHQRAFLGALPPDMSAFAKTAYSPVIRIFSWLLAAIPQPSTRQDWYRGFYYCIRSHEARFSWGLDTPDVKHKNLKSLDATCSNENSSHITRFATETGKRIKGKVLTGHCEGLRPSDGESHELKRVGFRTLCRCRWVSWRLVGCCC